VCLHAGRHSLAPGVRPRRKLPGLRLSASLPPIALRRLQADFNLQSGLAKLVFDGHGDELVHRVARSAELSRPRGQRFPELAAGHVLGVHPRAVSEPLKVVTEALNEGLIVLPGVRDEDAATLLRHQCESLYHNHARSSPGSTWERGRLARS